MDQAFESFFGWFGSGENGASNSLLWSADPHVQVVITAVLLLAFAAMAFIYVPFTLGLLRLGQLCRDVARSLADEDPSGLAARRGRVDDAMLRSSIAAQWESFLGRWRSAAVSDGGEERAPVRLAHVFEESPALPTGARRSLLPVLPGLFLASGTLGALVAIALAIPSASQVLDLDAELRVAELASSMEMALRTALWGLILSMGATVSSRWIEGSYERSSELLDQLVSTAYGYAPPGELAAPKGGGDFARLRGELAQMLDARFAVQAGAMRSLRELVADRDTTPQHIDVPAVAAVATSIEQAVSEVRNVSQTLSGAAGEVDAKLEALRLVSGSLEELARRASGDQEARDSAIGLLRELGDGLRGSAAEVSEVLSGAGLAGQHDGGLAEQRSFFEQALSGLGDSIAERFAPIDTQLQELRSGLDQLADPQHRQRDLEAQRGLIEAGLAVVTSSVGELRERLAGGAEATANADEADAQRQRLEEALAERVSSSIEAQLVPIEAQLQELRSQAAAAAEVKQQSVTAEASELREAAAQMREALAQVAAAGSEDSAAQRSLIETGLTQLTTTLGEKLGPIDDRLEQMSNEFAAAETATAPAESEAATLTSDLQTLAADLRQALESVSGQRDDNAQAQLALIDESLGRVASSLSERFDPIGEQIETMGAQLVTLAAAVTSDAGDETLQLGSVASDLRGVCEELRKSLEPAHGMMTTLDEQARSLFGAVGDLESHMDRVELSAAELRDGVGGESSAVREGLAELKQQLAALTESLDANREAREEATKSSATRSTPEHESNVQKALEKARKGKDGGTKSAASEAATATTVIAPVPKRKRNDMPDLETIRAQTERISPAAEDPEGSRPPGLSSLLSSKRSTKSRDSGRS